MHSTARVQKKLIIILLWYLLNFTVRWRYCCQGFFCYLLTWICKWHFLAKTEQFFAIHTQVFLKKGPIFCRPRAMAIYKIKNVYCIELDKHENLMKKRRKKVYQTCAYWLVDCGAKKLEYLSSLDFHILPTSFLYFYFAKT